jgi:hypothetical protein
MDARMIGLVRLQDSTANHNTSKRPSAITRSSDVVLCRFKAAFGPLPLRLQPAPGPVIRTFLPSALNCDLSFSAFFCFPNLFGVQICLAFRFFVLLASPRPLMDPTSRWRHDCFSLSSTFI